MEIKEVYEKYKHITMLDDAKILTSDGNPLFLCLYELWQAVKEHSNSQPVENSNTAAIIAKWLIKLGLVDMVKCGDITELENALPSGETNKASAKYPKIESVQVAFEKNYENDVSAAEYNALEFAHDYIKRALHKKRG